MNLFDPRGTRIESGGEMLHPGILVWLRIRRCNGPGGQEPASPGQLGGVTRRPLPAKGTLRDFKVAFSEGALRERAPIL